MSTCWRLLITEFKISIYAAVRRSEAGFVSVSANHVSRLLRPHVGKSHSMCRKPTFRHRGSVWLVDKAHIRTANVTYIVMHAPSDSSSASSACHVLSRSRQVYMDRFIPRTCKTSSWFIQQPDNLDCRCWLWLEMLIYRQVDWIEYLAVVITSLLNIAGENTRA